MRGAESPRLPRTSGAEATVVVCAWTQHRWEDLCRGVDAARDQGPARILVVIDHDEALLRRARSRWTDAVGVPVHVVPNRRTRGLSGARNTALELVETPVVVFLDDDARPQPGWLAALLAPYAEPGVVAVGGAADPVWETSTGQRPAHQPRELDWIVGCSWTGQPDQRSDVRNLMGCSMSLRVDVLRAVGGFDEDAGRVGSVPIGCEETEACIRIQQQLPSARVVLEPTSRVLHRVPAERATWTYLRARSAAEGLSKARVARRVGRRDATSVERDYVRRVLPRAVLRQLGRAARGDARGLVAALGVVTSLVWAAGGYARGSLGLRGRSGAAAAAQRDARRVSVG